MSIDLNFNREPYFDDYDPEKGYYKILFRPGFAVQTRELTQLQTTLQEQVDRFGRHIFRDGALALGGSFDIETDVRHIKVSGLPSIEAYQQLISTNVIGQTTGLRAYIIDGELDEETNDFVYIVRYRSSNENDDREFGANEVLTNDDLNVSVTTDSTDPVGPASIFSISEGVVFSSGFFVSFGFQRIILDKFSDTPTFSIGLNVAESIVDSVVDQSLLDNAAGTTNFTAPGADRFAIQANLIKVPLDQSGDTPDTYSELAVIENGDLIESVERTEYARIYDELAKRTYDQAGDFYVSGLGVRTREHLDTGVNEGLIPSTGLTNEEIEQLSNELSLDVEPGTAYVKGYEINQRVTEHVITDKAIDFEFVEGQVVSARTGGFIPVAEIVGSPLLNEGAIVDLYDTAENRITNNTRSIVAPTGNKIGEARLKSVLYDSGDLGTADGTLRFYLYDVQMTSSSFENVRAIHSAATDLFCDVVLSSSGNAELVETIDNRLLFEIGSDSTREIRDQDSNPSTTFIFHQFENKNVNFNNGGTFTIQLTGTNEAFPYGSGFLSINEKREFLISLSADIALPMVGTVSGTSGDDTLVGSGTSFTNLTVGSRISVDGDIYFIESIVDDTAMTVSPNLVSNYSAISFSREFYAGDQIDMTQKGSNGNFRSVEITTPTTAEVNLQEVDGSGSVSGGVNYRVNVNTVREIPKILRPDRYVLIDCSTLASLDDPIRLGLSDIFKINEVRRSSSPFVDETDGSDVTNSFIVDRGQRDNQYDHAFLIPQLQLSSSDYLLVRLDHFVPDFSFADSLGFFSVDSYPIDDTQVTNTTIFTYQIPRYTTSDGELYNLRDTLDFRPVKENTAADATDIASATTNPSDTTSFFESASGVNTPVANSRMSIDYSYFLARRDVVTLDQDGNVGIVRGVPGVRPVTPTVSENVMAIANVFITPFPSLAGSFARSIGRREIGCQTDRISHVRHTMRDIQVLKERIENLETVTSLNFLEKSASDLKIVDENGLDRFKNGFFVDNFASHILADSANLDYKVSIDKRNKELRPFFEMDAFSYEYDENESSGVQVTGDLVTVPYTEEVLVEQPRVSTTRNIERSVFRYNGELRLFPRHDTWVDETTVDKTVQFGEDISDELEASGINLMNTEWDSWQTHSKGTSTFTKTTRDRVTPNGIKWWERTLQTTTKQQGRIGTQYELGFEQQTEHLGNFVTDISVIPYIRPQVIKLFASSLLPNTRMYVFFDGEDMSDFVSPFTPDNTLELSPISSDFNDSTPLQSEGSVIRTDKFGVFYGELRLPASGKRFRVGTREVVLTDSPTNDLNDYVSMSENYFVAQGLEVQKQNTILSTQVPTVEQNSVRETRTKTKTKEISKRPTCLAYSFLVDVPENEEGVFLTSVDVFIQSLDPELGVWFEILEMDAGGSITQNQVPFSEVFMNREDERLNTSEDGTVPTNVNFESPIFLYNNVQYAFVVHTVGINPNTRFWAARIGDDDILTGEPITSRRLTGTTFTTNNGLNWDIVPDLDLKIRFNRAQFATGTAFGTASLRNEGYEFFDVTDESDVYDNIGEQIVSSDILTLSDLGAVTVGDTIDGLTSNATGEIVDITSDLKAVTTGFNFEQGEEFGVNGGASAGTITSIQKGQGRIEKYNPSTSRLFIDSTNGLFREGVVLEGAVSGITSTLSNISVFSYETHTLKPNHIKFNRTNIDFLGTTVNANSPLVFAESETLDPHENVQYRTEKIIHSHSNENFLRSGEPSSKIDVTMRTFTEYVSPVVDLSRAHAVYVHNIINDDTEGEDSLGFPNGSPVFDSSGEIEVKRGGNLENKYISRVITLAEGQDAEDIRLLISAYVPPNTSVPVYVKAKHREDGESLEDKEWIELQRNDAEVSSIVNRDDFRELEYGFPSSNLNSEGVFTYSVNGATFEGYKQLQIKIGLVGTNSAIVPRVKDLRSISLQV
jgi:hypothetical protein